ncbi:glycerol-3-phosphate acyltransferase 4 isoform X4 [Bombus vancouverensis nearcticus]|uniref:Glycerol-3-phosphate acyltransferase 3 isoform X3 n=2 Tax=Pyrobombus TaxID=144703 RepID=A0A6P8NS71_9HYME|nr:glycerol-3-phosphate acyltransferase 3 isoform X3 [Bombus impatiens]XP_033203315.1 glycerol-3-phosphate acyltransferase 3 isoform X3 [Bombus vancouverensis nearcticus]XP_033317042.1 glycerol-3-phosphate acyltransferase 3 isoform X3 [Bombus bifarius]XP_050484098.1 glycerol-3-phosphate acyltransferase 3 isoform X4 [Bombus huntii]
MAPLWMVMSLAVSLLLTPFLMFLLAIIFLASIGKSLGVRRLYIKLLLTLFEYGRQNIENVKKKNGTWKQNDEDTDEEYESRHVEKQNVQNWKTESMQNGVSSTVIARSTDLILVPEPEMQNHKNHLEETKTENSQTPATSASKSETLIRRDSFETLKREFKPAICLDYIKAGVEAIIEDEVTSRFEAEELKNWNLLTRTNRHYEFISWKLTVIWICGFVMRYCFLLPLRIFICFVGIGQRHGGFLGILQRALARASPHIWFERCEVKDREAVTRRLKKHVSDPTNPPILIFPEGTCINNTSVMQFKKGSFEVGGVIYPVAIKYDPRFGDAFWNSSRYSMIQYLYMTMSSWAIVCDVWYLPPMYRNEGESAIDFANRVKSVIARQGGLVDLQWDGQLKRIKPKKELREKQQEELSKRLKDE